MDAKIKIIAVVFLCCCLVFILVGVGAYMYINSEESSTPSSKAAAPVAAPAASSTKSSTSAPVAAPAPAPAAAPAPTAALVPAVGEKYNSPPSGSSMCRIPGNMEYSGYYTDAGTNEHCASLCAPDPKCKAYESNGSTCWYYENNEAPYSFSDGVSKNKCYVKK